MPPREDAVADPSSRSSELTVRHGGVVALDECRPAGRQRPDHRADRPQRRRQDDLHRRPDRLHRPRAGRVTWRRAGHRADRAAPAGPDAAWCARSSPSSCSTTSPCGRTSLVAARPSTWWSTLTDALWPQAPRRRRRRRGARRDLDLALVADRTPRRCRTASATSSPSPAPWSPGPAWCSSTSPRAGLDPTETDELADVLRRLAGARHRGAARRPRHGAGAWASATRSTCSTSGGVDRLGTAGARSASDPASSRPYLGDQEPRRERATPRPHRSTPRRRCSPLRGLRAGYGGVAVVHDLDLTVGAGRGRRPARGQRRRQDHHPPRHLRPRSGRFGGIDRGARRGRSHAAGASGPRRVAAGPAGVAHVPEDRGLFFDLTVGREPPARRPPGRRRRSEVDRVLEWFPALRGPRTDGPGSCPVASSRCSPSPGRWSAARGCCSSTS